MRKHYNKKLFSSLIISLIVGLVCSVCLGGGVNFLKAQTPTTAEQTRVLTIDTTFAGAQYIVSNGQVYTFTTSSNNACHSEPAEESHCCSHPEPVEGSLAAIRLQSHTTPLSLNSTQSFQLIFLNDSATSLSSFASTQNAIASILTVSKPAEEVSITLQYPHGTAYATTSPDAEYTLGSLAVNTNSSLTFANGEFNVGEPKGATSLTAVATSKTEAMILDIRSGSFTLSGSVTYKPNDPNCRAFLQTGGTLTLDGPTITGFGISGGYEDEYGNWIDGTYGSVLLITNGTFNFNSGVIGSAEERPATEEDYANNGNYVIDAYPDSETADVTVNLNGGIIGRNVGGSGNTFSFCGCNTDEPNMHLNLLGTTFQYNYTDYGDCIIYVNYFCETVVDGSVFKNNQTSGSLFWDEESGSTFTMASGQFIDNQIGGILVSMHSINITSGTFEGNLGYSILYCSMYDDTQSCTISSLTVTDNEFYGEMFQVYSYDSTNDVTFSNSNISDNIIGYSLWYSEGSEYDTLFQNLTINDNYCYSVFYPGGANVVLSNIFADSNTVEYEFLYSEMFTDSLTIKDTFSVTNNHVLDGYSCTIFADSSADIYLQGDITIDCNSNYGAIGAYGGNIYLQTNHLNFVNNSHSIYQADIRMFNADALIYAQAQLTAPLTIYKEGLTCTDMGDISSNYMVHSTNADYLNSAAEYISIANLLGSSTILSTTEKPNYVVCTPTFATGLFDSETGERIYTWLELLENDMITVEDGVLSGNDDSMAGKLVISPSVSTIGDSAFGDYYSLIEVVIPSSVETIENYAFGCCENITSITIGNSVVSIGASAFSDCYALTSVTIPNSVVSIGEYAFYYCSGLTGVTIPNSVVSIGAYAFSECYALTSVTIPNSVTSIGEGVFTWCTEITGLTVNAANTTYHSKDNCIIETDTGALIQGCNISIIPDYVTSIGNYAFAGCSGLTGDLTIPDGVTSIGGSAFQNCSGLNSVIIGNSVTSIGEYAFQSCSCLTGDLTIPDSVTTIGSAAFSYCSGLTSLTIGNSVTTIGSSAFYGCNGLTGDLTIPDSVTSIGGSAFGDCTGVQTLYYNGKVTKNFTSTSYVFRSLGKNSATGTCEVIIGDNVTTIPAYMFHEGSYHLNGITSVTIGNSVTSIGSYAFYGCSGLTGELVIPDSVTSIGYATFYYCRGLTSVTIPANVTSIGNYAFGDCTGVQTLYYNGKVTKNFTSTSYEFRSLGKNSATGTCEVIIGDNVTTIPAYMFYATDTYPNGITSITIGNSVTTIGNYAFYGCTGVQTLTYNGNVTTNFTSTSYVFRDLGKASATGTCEVIIGDNVTTIPAYMFYAPDTYPNGITSITIGNSVTSIGNYAFYGCTAVQTLTYNGNVTTNFTSTSYVFRDLGKASATGTCEVIIGDNVTTIPAYMFYAPDTYPNGITSITIGNSVTSIGSYAFSGCTGVQTLTYNGNVTTDFTYTSYVFRRLGKNSATGTCEVIIGDNVTTIPEFMFYATSNSSGITSVSIGNSVTSIGDRAFYYCSGLTNLTIGNSVTSIGSYTFTRCSGITSVTIPNSVTCIGSYAFYGCSGLTGNLVIPNSVTSIGEGVFSLCTEITGLTVNAANTTYHSKDNCIIETDTGALIQGCNISIIPDYVTSIGNIAFSGCSGLTSIFIPSSVTTIYASSYSSSPFYNCSSSLVIYCEASATQSGWGTYWNYYASGKTLTTYYGCTRDDAGNIYLSDGTLAVSAPSATSLANWNANTLNISLANLDTSTSTSVVCLVAGKDDETEALDVILNKKDDYNTDIPPVVNQTTSV